MLIVLALHSLWMIKAQTEYRKAYIITNSNDTLFGTIDFTGDENLYVKCRFKNASHQITEYKPFDIKGFRFIDGKYYVSKYSKSRDQIKPIFAEYLVKAIRNLYYYRDYTSHFLIDYHLDTTTDIPYYQKIVNRDDVNYYYNSTLHIGYLKNYFSDCKAITDTIDKIETPTVENLVALTKRYHHLVCGDSGCIVYYKPRPKFSVAIEPVYGMNQYQRMDIEDRPNFIVEYGLLAYIWLPTANENLYFKTGYMYSQFTAYGYVTSLYRIPIGFEYVFPNQWIKPTFGIGVNAFFEGENSLYQGTAPTIYASAGLLIKINKFVYWEISLQSDLLAFNYYTHLLLSDGGETGLFFKF